MYSSFSSKNIVSYYLLISILFFGYNILQLPKMPYFALRLLLMLIVVFYVINKKNSVVKSNSIQLFSGYFIYLFFTLFLFFVNGSPVELIPEALISGLFPMLFFFVGTVDKNESVFESRFYKYYFGGSIILFFCSVYLFVTMPSWYLEWKISMQPEEWQENINILGTMSGFSGSGYLVGYTAFFSFCYILFKFKTKVAKKVDILYLSVVVFCMIFSQVRIAFLTSAIVLIWYFKTALTKRNFIIIIVTSLAFIFVINYIVTNSETLNALFDMFFSKLERTAEDSRYKTGFTLLSQQTNYLFGHGYGTGGHKANLLELPSVTDFEYVKLFYETGLVGFMLFLIINVKAICVFFHKRPRYDFEMCIILFYLLAMLVANPLSAEATMSPIYWYALGRVIS